MSFSSGGGLNQRRRVTQNRFVAIGQGTETSRGSGYQLVVAPPFDDPAAIQNHDLIGVADRGEPVRR